MGQTDLILKGDLMRDEIVKIYKNLNEYDSKTVKIGGWVKSVRANKEFGFIDFTDGFMLYVL